MIAVFAERAINYLTLLTECVKNQFVLILHWINKKEVTPAKFGHIGNDGAKLASRFQVVCTSSSGLLSCYLVLL